MNDKYPNLIETITFDDIGPTYMKGVGVLDSDLTDVEKVVLKRSRRYVERCRADRNMRLLRLAREDFEKLRDIPNMPDEALDILRVWTIREEDEWDYDIDDIYE